MKQMSTKLKLVVCLAIALVAILFVVSIAQLVSIHIKNKRAAQQQERIDNLAQTIASHNPPTTTSIQIQNVTISFEG